MCLAPLLKNKDYSFMKKISSILFLLVLLLAHSDFLKANTQEDCFDAIGLITVGKYLDFKNALAPSVGEPSKLNADLTCEGGQAITDAPMLGLSKEEAMEYLTWAENGNDDYDLISNKDGSFSLIQNKNELNFPLMFGLWGPANNRARQDPELNRPLNTEQAGLGNREQPGLPPEPREHQGNELPAENAPTVTDFINAALTHFDAEQLLVSLPNEANNNPVIAKSVSEYRTGSERQQRRRQDTKERLKQVILSEYRRDVCGSLSLPIIDERVILYSSPLSSLNIFWILMTVEQAMTTKILNMSESLTQEQWNEYGLRQKSFRDSAIKFAQKFAAIPETDQRWVQKLKDLADVMTGDTTINGGWVGVTLNNHDTFMLAVKGMGGRYNEKQREAQAIALWAHFNYEKKLVAKAQNQGKYQWEEATRPDEQGPVDEGFEAIKNELKEYWGNTKNSYQFFTKVRDGWINARSIKDRFLWTHAIEGVNQSTVWFSRQRGGWNPFNWSSDSEWMLIRQASKGSKVPGEVYNVLKGIYSLRQLLHEMIMHRGLFSWDRQVYVERAEEELKKLQNVIATYPHEGINANEWKGVMGEILPAAKETFEIIQDVHRLKEEGYVF